MKLERILEPEVMDTPDEAADYDAMDHTAVNRQFVEDLLAAQNAIGPIAERWELLDLGCGTAQLPIALCERSPFAQVLAADLSIEMLELARFNVEAAGLIDRIQLAHLDAKRSDCDDESFDSVVSNSIIHHIPEPVAALREAIRIVKPGGLLFFRDLLRPADEQQLDQLVQQYAGEESDHARQMFRDSLHAALTVEEMRQLTGEFGFASETVAATSDRHWTWSAVKPASPAAQ